MDDMTIARIVHNVNRAYCRAIGDNSQSPWEEAEQWQRDSAINGVGFHKANPDAKPDHSHNAWWNEKLEAGWKWGEVKDPDLKTHPCCVPYDELPNDQKAKDYIFAEIVRELMRLD